MDVTTDGPAATPPASPVPPADPGKPSRLRAWRDAIAGKARPVLRPLLAAGRWGGWKTFPSTWTFWGLFAGLILLAAFLRFWRLDFQSYWTDESHTIYRIFGDYSRMLKRLEDQGFPPGWYTWLRAWANFQEWRLGDGAAAFAPASLRALPALLGTLMVPTCYFLARQFMDRRGALLVMLLAAVNPFLVYYSRDIKMYAAMWLFVTLNMALFFKWQSAGRHWLWLPLYVLSGVAATAMHGMAWLTILLQLVYVITRPRPRALDAMLWVVGVFFIALLPIWWFSEGTKWLDNAVEGKRTGLEWNTRYTDMSWKTVASLPASHVLGVLWPEQPPSPRTAAWFGLDGHFHRHLGTRSWPWLASLELWAIVGLFALMVVGLFPWRGRREDPERAASVTRGRWWWVGLWVALPALGLALTWLPPPSQSVVTGTVQVADANRALNWRGLGARNRIRSGSFEIRILGTDTREEISVRVPVRPSGEGFPGRPGYVPGMTLSALAKSISPQTGDVIRGTVTADNRLQLAAADKTSRFCVGEDTSGVLSGLGVAMDPEPESWYTLVWGWRSKPPIRIWEPRYLGVIVPALLLWVAVCLRRLPTVWLRAAAGVAVVGACTFSSLSNHLIYRNAPYDVIAETVMKYRTRAPDGKLPDPASVTWNAPSTPALREQDVYHLQIRAGIRPWVVKTEGDPTPPKPNFFVAPEIFWPWRFTGDDGFLWWDGYKAFLDDARSRKEVAAIVLTDRLGDLPDVVELPSGKWQANPMSDEAVSKYLGPSWRLESRQTYRWHYEWRFNFFHTWRTRVWVRVGEPEATTKPG